MRPFEWRLLPQTEVSRSAFLVEKLCSLIVAAEAVVTVESVFFAFQAPVEIIKKKLRSFLDDFHGCGSFHSPRAAVFSALENRHGKTTSQV